MIKVPRDILWKGILEDFFPDFLQYFFSNANEIFDFEKGVQFLDKELEQLFPESKNKNRRADKLAKVFLKDGTETWILAHVEVQGYVDKEFSLRMFQYYYRIKDKHKKPVIAFAILTDDDPNFRPTMYVDDYLGTKVVYQYHTLKLLDYRPEDFQKTDNIFAFALEVAWYGLKAHKPKEGVSIYQLKMNLFRRIQSKGYNASDFRQLLKFIKNYVSFGNSEMLLKFEEETSKPIESMGIIERVETYYKTYGVREGKRIGKKLGREEGRVEGRVEGIDIGLYQQLSKNVCQMFSKGFDIVKIADILEVSEDEVKKILKLNNLI
jgi:predicted transposase YdaD